MKIYIIYAKDLIESELFTFLDNQEFIYQENLIRFARYEEKIWLCNYFGTVKGSQGWTYQDENYFIILYTITLRHITLGNIEVFAYENPDFPGVEFYACVKYEGMGTRISEHELVVFG